MARRVYFAFHFEADIWRVNKVRNANVVLGVDDAGFFDHSEYEEAKQKSEETIRRMVRAKLADTSVTVVLIGERTWSRDWVNYEIDESLRKANELVGVRIHMIYDRHNQASRPGKIPIVPSGIRFPTMIWQPRTWNTSVARLRALIEAAGKRADQQRLRDVLRRRRNAL